MRKLLGALALLVLFAVPALAQNQQITGNLTAADSGSCATSTVTVGSAVSLALNATSGATIVQLSGTWSATVAFQSTADGTHWVSVAGYQAGTGATTTSSNGAWQINVAGFTGVRACVSSYSSGTAFVVLTSSPASASSSSSGGLGPATPEFAIYVSPFCGGASNCYPVYDDGQVVWNNATYSSGSPDVACSACTFTASDVGKIFFATNVLYPGYTSQLTSVVSCPQTTIKTVTDSHDIVLNANCTANSITETPIIWGSDDSTNLATAWNAVVAACSTLQLPGINAESNGPAVMLVQQAEFNTSAGTPTRANCGLGAEAQRSGIGIHGVDISASYLIATPNFNFSTCTYGISGKACLASVNDGANFTDFSIWGGGVSNPSGATSNVIMEVDGVASVTPTSGNNTLSRINIMGWGAGSAGIGVGLQLDGGTLQCQSVNVDGAGMDAVKVTGSGSAQGCSLLTAFDTWDDNIVVTGGATFSTSTGIYGITGNSSGGCAVGVTGGGTWASTGDFIGNVSVGPSNGICVGYAASIGVGAGTATLFGTTVSMGNVLGTAAYIGSSNGKLYASASAFTITGSGSTGVYNTGSFFDLGGNRVSGPTNYACVTCVGLFGSPSITGVTLATTGVALTSGWGSGTTVSAASGDSHSFSFTITLAGTTTTPVATVTFPTPYLVAPKNCIAQTPAGTDPLAGTVTVGTPSATAVTFSYTGTFTATDTIIQGAICN